jgi:hypothetical protein
MQLVESRQRRQSVQDAVQRQSTAQMKGTVSARWTTPRFTADNLCARPTIRSQRFLGLGESNELPELAARLGCMLVPEQTDDVALARSSGAHGNERVPHYQPATLKQ